MNNLRPSRHARRRERRFPAEALAEPASSVVCATKRFQAARGSGFQRNTRLKIGMPLQRSNRLLHWSAWLRADESRAGDDRRDDPGKAGASASALAGVGPGSFAASVDSCASGVGAGRVGAAETDGSAAITAVVGRAASAENDCKLAAVVGGAERAIGATDGVPPAPAGAARAASSGSGDNFAAPASVPRAPSAAIGDS